MQPLKRKCLGTIAYIGVGSVPEPFCWSMIQLVQFCNEYICEPGEWINFDRGVKSGQVMQRNILAQRMLGDWILYIDSDHDFEPDLAFRLLSVFTKRKLDVLSGFYQFKEYPHQPMAWVYLQDKEGYAQIANWDRGLGLMKVQATGAGCVLIRRSVIERLVTHYGEAPFDPIGKYTTDDFDFFERCRLIGIECWWAPRIECPHLMTRAVTSADYDLDYVMAKSQRDLQKVVA